MLRKTLVPASLGLFLALFITGCRAPLPTLPGPTPAKPKLNLPAPAHTGLTLPGLFSHHMVLQQGMSVPIWGWADEGETISVTFRNQTVSDITKDGKWMVKLHSLKPGGPDILTIRGTAKSITLTNVLVGEVWLASGQSNMEWPLKSSFQPEADIAHSANPMIRFVKVPKRKADQMQPDVAANWIQCTPETTPESSAVAYYFACSLQKARGVPVGIIQSYWGGSPAEAWMRRDVLESNARYQKEILDPYPEAERKFAEDLAAYEKRKAAAEAKGEPFKEWGPWRPWKPSELYNGMIAPLVPYAIKGAIWYQGESNAGRAHQYRDLFPDMIRNWRNDWGQGNFPFLAVQLAPFKPIKHQPAESDWAELREAQLLATKALPKVGMVVITDVGEENDIHPRKKQPVGARLALAARAIAYGEDIEYSGPIYKSMSIEGNKVVLSFKHVDSGLKSEGALKGFAVCGPDRKFVWAPAEIQGNKVVVSSPSVPNPIAVRYGWADFPVVNLYNKEGLPASPFRTDNFPMTTAPK